MKFETEPAIMPTKKILLAIDGSMYSKYAAQAAWQLSEKTGGQVTALHVVDAKSAWELVGQTEPGMLSEDDYLLEKEVVLESLARLSCRLRASYTAECEKRGIAPRILIKQGNPADIIAEVSMEFDLVVLGHKPFNPALDDRYQRQFLRLSLAESLAHWCPVPLMIVQAPLPAWKSMTLLLSSDHINSQYITHGLELATQLQTQPVVVVLSTDGVTEPPVELIRDLKATQSGLSDVPVAVTANDIFADQSFEVWDNPLPARDWDSWNDTLITMPTREVAGRRLTIANGSPSRFVRYLTMPAVLFYPEDRPHLVERKDLESVLSTSTI